ncbi:hypothetical protein PoB_006323300 [Plakobranchus ocellatus]|uniref:Uncharacterized protein n=1 Tax=Plakobranchus ocellatus TaxID=259542 RepID=A0AAV4CY07_9GAST|nr:hypothetical protein PoB_006323300 [Plakobranchus ocellatus]
MKPFVSPQTPPRLSRHDHHCYKRHPHQNKHHHLYHHKHILEHHQPPPQYLDHHHHHAIGTTRKTIINVTIPLSLPLQTPSSRSLSRHAPSQLPLSH